MFGEETVITSAPDNQESSSGNSGRPQPRSVRKIILIAALLAALIILGVIIFLLVQKYWLTPVNQPAGPADPAMTGASSSAAVLPDLSSPSEEETASASSTFSNLAVEYLTFADFYEAPDNNLATKINDYSLPLNVKIDVMNYYDISRKLSLDPYLESLNTLGFTVIDNPWTSSPDFSSLYANLDSKQIPFLVTSDFIIYYYQNILKEVFKDIEENVFYDNLWDINKDLYQTAKTRYEARLASIGNINDPVLEAERLETAFFAVALELLKPASGQIAPKGAIDNQGMFAAGEADRFYFVAPPYLRDDVLAEVSLIRSGQAVRAKSPGFLYNRNYTEFTVPSEYKQNAKLNNFYLTTKWLNSSFPLNYRGPDCPDCLLDKNDWRINLTAASLIAQDFANQPELKNRWARIYKIMSFFKGLREDLNYIHYRDSLIELFGDDYKSEELFAAKNEEALANLEKLRAKLLTYSWPEISGALDKSAVKPWVGLKLLAEPYWPNDYIFRRLTSPSIGAYLGTTTPAFNQTICSEKQGENRCNGLALDPINLVYPIGANSYFSENTNYLNYDRESAALRAELAEMNAWQSTNYWTTLALVKAYLNVDKENQPLFARSTSWRDQTLRTAAGAWINLQLPLQKFSFSGESAPDKSLGFTRDEENFYVDPNLPLINEILANNNMLLKMFSALQMDLEVRLAVSSIRNFSSRLTALKSIVVKELSGEELTTADNETIATFVRELKVETPRAREQQLSIRMPAGSNLDLDLSKFKLLVLVHQEGESKVFSVGPVWDYKESR